MTAIAKARGRTQRADGVADRSFFGRMRPQSNPWRRPWFLEGFTWLYLIWSIAPDRDRRAVLVQQRQITELLARLLVALVLRRPGELGAARSQSARRRGADVRLSVYVTLITVPLGVAFALGINRWRGYISTTFNFTMILSYVIPELIFGVAVFFVFTILFKGIGLGTLAETLALVTWNISWPAIIVQARLVTLGKAVRGGRRRPRREPVADHPQGDDPAARARHLRQRRPRLLQRRRRLRPGRPAELQRQRTRRCRCTSTRSSAVVTAGPH